jgi:hypothetical protein
MPLFLNVKDEHLPIFYKFIFTIFLKGFMILFVNKVKIKCERDNLKKN